ncbi:MAG: tetratricopeptide repeat protein [Magnetococcales bacterium]|nr:tetratricopeptide repeat protein [Magnetococcales bacterium]NGZ26528.1 tetratricopeptide repeat protein [Magnetococcales bacterium]
MKRPTIGHQPSRPSPLPNQRLLQQGMQYHQQGQLPQAEKCYQQVLQQTAQQPDALHLLGLIRHQQGNHQEASQLIQQAIRSWNGNPLFYFNLAKVHAALGENQQAANAYRQAMVMDPAMAAAYTGLARILLQLDNWQEGAKMIQSALLLQPRDPLNHNLQGLYHKRQNNLPAAITSFRQALQLNPHYPEAINNLGITLRQAGQSLEALTILQQAIELNPRQPESLGNLGHVFLDLTRWQDAENCFQNALALQPNQLEWLLFLVYARLEQNKSIDEPYQQLLNRTEPPTGSRHTIPQQLAFYLAQLHLRLRNDILAADHFAHLLPNAPDPLACLAGRAKALSRAGLVEQALHAVEEMLSRQDDLVFQSFRLNLLNYVEEDAHFLLEQHRDWQNHATVNNPYPPPSFTHHQPMRIGYISPDFRNHSVSQFFLPVLRHHNREQFAVHLYAHLTHPDKISALLRGMTHQWLEIHTLNDFQVAEQIRQDGIDILVDLAGHSADNRLGVFLHRPAPIQATWLGYPNTTGLSAMDYRITDPVADPLIEGEKAHSESLVRLPHAFFCYQPPEQAPKPSPPPALEKGYPTFASFNNLAKVTPQVVATWAVILQQLPTARLSLMANTLFSPAIRQRLNTIFYQYQVDPARILYQDKMPFADYLRYHSQVDVILDTFPWNGHTVTCHALWMGVPLITLAGKRHASRMGASILHQLGLEQWVATTREEYIHKAVQLAEEPEILLTLRRELRQRMSQSPLMDAATFTKNLENLYLTLQSTRATIPQD